MSCSPLNFLVVHAFPPRLEGHGGNRRSWQVAESFTKLGKVCASTVFNDPTRSVGVLRLLTFAVSGYLWQLRHGALCADPKAALLIGAAAAFVKEQVAKWGSDCILVWEGSVGCNWFLGAVAKAQGLRVIAVPHNIDSLVQGIKQPFLRQRKRWLEFEAALYARCDLVLGIAHEDVWLLRLHGVNAHWWPYCGAPMAPAGRVAPAASQPYCLCFGTALNAPTADGMRLVSRVFRRDLPDVQLMLVGRGTDRFRGDPDFDGAACLGEVSDEQLARLIGESACIVVHQPPATGALTRLVDLERYGVAVLCNVDAYRSAHFLTNVVCYASEAELITMVKRIIGGQPLNGQSNALNVERIGTAVAAMAA